MKKLILFIFCFYSISWGQNHTEEYIKNELIIKLKSVNSFLKPNENQIGIKELDRLNNLHEIQKIESIGKFEITSTLLLKFKTEKDIFNLINQYQKLSCIEYVEPNYIAQCGGQSFEQPLSTFPNDTHFNKQWGLYNNGTLSGVGNITNDADVDMELAWDIETGDPNMIIAIPDTGLKMDHPDIASRIWVNPNEVPNNNIDDDNNGLIDDINGWDWVNNDNNPTDDHGHGTNVIGIIGAIPNNNNLFSGSNWNSKIMPLKVLNSNNSATYAAMANSIYYAVDKGAKVISFSIGGSSSSTTVENAINYTHTHQVIFVACMMNFNNNTTYYPAGYSTTYNNVIAVGSTNPDDTRTAPFFWSGTSGSNYGNHINVVAPGNYIYGLNHTSNTNSSTYWGGTSQATPLVAGIASLVLAKNPALTPNQVRTILQNTAEDQKGNPSEDVAGFDQYHGWGRVNAYQALQDVLLNQEDFEVNHQKIKIVNPVVNKQIEIINNNHLTDKATVKIYSILGQKVIEKEILLTDNSNFIEFNFSKGVYILDFIHDEYKKTYKIKVL